MNRNITQFSNPDLYFNQPSVIYVKLLFEKFDIAKFKLEFSVKKGVDIFYSYSFDAHNWSNPVTRENFNIDSDCKDVYVAAWFVPHDPNRNITAYTLFTKRNVNDTPIEVSVSRIEYNGTRINHNAPDDIRCEFLTSVLNKYPKWNFYDGQEVTVRRWLEQCSAINEMYGHTVIYFRTEPVETETIHTFANHVVRNVTGIKRIKINIPNNELPQDRSAYTDWDYMLQDEFSVHVINEKFRLAFGPDAVPDSKDYLFFPLNNKLYRVSAVQPKNGFMGKIGWWEVFLSKYEEDECVVMSDEIRKAAGFGEDFENSIEAVDETADDDIAEDENLRRILSQTERFIEQRVENAEHINQRTTDEKKEVTQWFTNKNVDSTSYIDNRETEKQRAFINKRLDIVTVNPENNTFPISMYNCSSVDKRVVGMVYDIKDFTSVSKNSRRFTNVRFEFNLVFTSYFTGELFDFEDQNKTPLMTVQANRSKIEVVMHNGEQQVIPVEYKFEKDTFYRIELYFHEKQLSVNVFTIADKNKSLDYQNIYILNNIVPLRTELETMYLFGGSYLTNDIKLNIDRKPILQDNCNPLLVMDKFMM